VLCGCAWRTFMPCLIPKHPRVDPTRIALMGFSRGGQATLYASLRRFHQLWNKSGVEFAAYVPFYPDCMTTFLSDTDVVDRPIRIFGGTRDDYNPISACKAYVERLRTAGSDVELTEYPNASHAFDNPLGAQPATSCSLWCPPAASWQRRKRRLPPGATRHDILKQIGRFRNRLNALRKSAPSLPSS
jgi:dienelactone hydrolase